MLTLPTTPDQTILLWYKYTNQCNGQEEQLPYTYTWTPTAL